MKKLLIILWALLIMGVLTTAIAAERYTFSEKDFSDLELAAVLDPNGTGLLILNRSLTGATETLIDEPYALMRIAQYRNPGLWEQFAAYEWQTWAREDKATFNGYRIVFPSRMGYKALNAQLRADIARELQSYLDLIKSEVSIETINVFALSLYPDPSLIMRISQFPEAWYTPMESSETVYKVKCGICLPGDNPSVYCSAGTCAEGCPDIGTNCNKVKVPGSKFWGFDDPSDLTPNY